MPATLTLSGLDVSVGPRTLVTGLDLVVAPGDVTAVVGANGSGKSSLLRTIVGELTPGAGTVRVSPTDATLGWLPQERADPAETLLAHARRRTGVWAADRELELASADLAEAVAGSEHRYSDALERWLALGAADLKERLPAVMSHVGLVVAPARTLGSLSGGQLARAALATVLLSRYDVLLLDEPTNDLDAEGRAVLEEYVVGHEGPVVVASHDRAFLDRVATEVVELDLAQRLVRRTTGGWSDHVAAREVDRRRAEQEFAAYAERRDDLVAQSRQRAGWADTGRRKVAVGGEADKHIREKHRARADRQAAKGARLRAAADRLDEVAASRREWQLRYSVDAGSPSADVVWALSSVVVRRRGFSLGPVDLVVERGDRLAIDGPNGSGKSTLLAVMLGTLPVASGRVSLGARTRVGHLDQARSLLDTDRPVADTVGSLTGIEQRGDVRTLLAKYGLGADHVDRPARTLSLGERTRALMAVFSARRCNVLVLDEPTNHLDVPALEQLESALASYAGTLVVVSHDEAFLEHARIDRRVSLG